MLAAVAFPWGVIAPLAIALVLCFVAVLVIKAVRAKVERRFPSLAGTSARTRQRDRDVDEPNAEVPIRFAYQQKRLLSAAEFSLLRSLEAAVDGRARLFAKVRIGDVIVPQHDLSRSDEAALRNRVQSKHFDLIICSPHTLEVLAVIELDDRSHQRRERQVRDEFVDELCASVGLKLLRFPARAGYSLHELREQLGPVLPLRTTAGV